MGSQEAKTNWEQAILPFRLWFDDNSSTATIREFNRAYSQLVKARRTHRIPTRVKRSAMEPVRFSSRIRSKLRRLQHRRETTCDGRHRREGHSAFAKKLARTKLQEKSKNDKGGSNGGRSDKNATARPTTLAQASVTLHQRTGEFKQPKK